MAKTNHLLCRGDACPLRMSCNRYFEWQNTDDCEESEMEPDYHDGECYAFDRKEYYGG